MSAHVAQNCNAHTAGIYRGLAGEPHPARARHDAARHGRARPTSRPCTTGSARHPGPPTAPLAVLSKMFSLAAAWGLVADGSNPCRAVRKYREKKRERFLSRDEYRHLGQAPGGGRGGRGGRRRGRGLALRHRRAPPPHAHRMPVERDPHAALGRRGPHRRRVSPPRRQDRCAHGPPHAHRRDGAGRGSVACLTTPGSSSASSPAPTSPPSPPSGIACAPAPASTTCASTTSAIPMRAARSRQAKASP